MDQIPCLLQFLWFFVFFLTPPWNRCRYRPSTIVGILILPRSPLQSHWCRITLDLNTFHPPVCSRLEPSPLFTGLNREEWEVGGRPRRILVWRDLRSPVGYLKTEDPFSCPVNYFTPKTPSSPVFRWSYLPCYRVEKRIKMNE